MIAEGKTNHTHKSLMSSKRGARIERGFALIAALLMLVVLTLLGVSLMSGGAMQEKMSSNTREKARAFDAAQLALMAAQNYLSGLTAAPVGASCVGATTNPRVCNTALASPTITPWINGVTYTPTCAPQCMRISGGGGENTYAAAPQYYIQDMSVAGSNPHLYLITAQATGGNPNAVVVVQSVYALSGSSGGSTQASSVSGP